MFAIWVSILHRVSNFMAGIYRNCTKVTLKYRTMYKSQRFEMNYPLKHNILASQTTCNIFYLPIKMVRKWNLLGPVEVFYVLRYILYFTLGSYLNIVILNEISISLYYKFAFDVSCHQICFICTVNH